MIVDASVAMAWCFEDEASEATEGVLRQVVRDGAVVPSLWWQEVANVLLVAQRRGRLDAAAAARAAELLEQLPLTTVIPAHGIDELVGLASRHGLSAYDATYLAMAMSGGFPLATLDGELARAAEECGVRLVIPHQ